MWQGTLQASRPPSLLLTCVALGTHLVKLSKRIIRVWLHLIRVLCRKAQRFVELGIEPAAELEGPEAINHSVRSLKDSSLEVDEED